MTLPGDELRERGKLGSALWPVAAWAAAAAVIAVCVGIVAYLFVQGGPTINWHFLSNDPNPSLTEAQSGGIRVPIAGTVLLIVLSLVVAVPLALASATYLAEYMDERRLLTRIVRIGLEVLASVPSVVFGMFGLALFTRPMFTFLSSAGAEANRAAFGRSFLVAAIVMGVHVLPFIVKVMEEAIRSVPRTYRDAASALGLPKWRSLRRVVLPAAAPGLSTAVILGMGLVAGDTAIVWLTLGGTVSMGSDTWWRPDSWNAVLHGTGATLTTFTYYTSPVGEGMAPEMAFGAALVLVGIILVLNAGATVLSRIGSRHHRR